MLVVATIDSIFTQVISISFLFIQAGTFQEKIFRRTAHQTDRREGVRLEECSQADGELIGKKQEKGRAMANRKVPAYSTDAGQEYAIDERMKKLGRLERYNKELFEITNAQNLPPEWATPEQKRCVKSEKYGRKK